MSEPAPQQYPVHATMTEHDRHSRAGDMLIAAVAIAGIGVWAGYELGWEHFAARAIAEAQAAPQISACPASDPDQDVLEHAWIHRGQVIHRECLIVNKPVYAQPRYSMSPKGL